MSERIRQFKVQPEKSLFSPLFRLIIVLCVIVLCFIAVVIFRPTIVDNEKLKAEIAAMENELAAERAKLAEQRREVELIKNDPEYLELVARRLRPLMKPEETIFQITTDSTGASTAVPVESSPQ